MIVIIQKDTQEPALRQLAVRLMNQGVRIGRTPGQDADVLTLVGDTWRLDPEGLAALPYVLDVRRITPPYRLASRAAHPENTVVEVGSARPTGGTSPLPCGCRPWARCFCRAGSGAEATSHNRQTGGNEQT